MTEEISVNNPSTFLENNYSGKESSTNPSDEENLFFSGQKTDETMETTPGASVDQGNEQEIELRANSIGPLGLTVDQLDDDSDDEIQVTIGNIQTAAAQPFLPRHNNRSANQPQQAMAMKNQPNRGLDLDAQGTINGQPTYEHDITTAYKDDEKPWKKPGADISDYFNYGFTEETWAAYCDRQRRLRSENHIARLNAAQMPPMAPMMPGHPPMMHPMNPLPVIMNKPPINMQMIPPRPYIPQRKPDGKIDVIGGTDQTSRRQMHDLQNSFDHPPFLNGPQFPGGQPPNGQTVGDLVPTSPASNGPPSAHGTPTGGNHNIPTLGGHRMPMMPPGMSFRPPYGHPHMPGGPPFFAPGPAGPMHGERAPGPFFLAHPPQQPWDKPGVPGVHGFPPGHFPPQAAVPGAAGNGRPASSRSATPEDRSSRSSTPEENRPSGGNGANDNDKSSKDERYKERYRDSRDRHPSSHRRSSPKDRSSSYRSSRHRSGDHEYERPRSDRKSSRDRDDKYDRYSRKRHHRDESSRHHRSGEDDSSRSHRSRRTPTKNFSSPPKSNDPTQGPTETADGQENNPSSTPTTSGSPSASRSRREGSSSRHSHHKKSSKRSRRDDSGDERSHHRRRSKEKSSSSKKSSNPNDPAADGKDQQQQSND